MRDSIFQAKELISKKPPPPHPLIETLSGSVRLPRYSVF